MTQEKNLNMDTTIVATSSQTSSQTTPIDVKLLLCQLVIDAKEGNTWHDIYDKYINHPLVTTLHNKEAPIITNISEEELAAFVIKIINETVSSIDISETTTVAVKRPRGRRAIHPSHTENGATTSGEKLIDTETCDIDYFQHTDSNGREYLSICISKLHRAAVAEIKRKLSNNRKLFSRLLT